MSERTTVEKSCRDCGNTFTYETSGRTRRILCDPCGTASNLRSWRESALRAREARGVKDYPHCSGCGAPFDKPRRRAGSKCAECKRVRAREYQQRLRDSRPKVETVFCCVSCGSDAPRTGNSGRQLYCPPCGDAAAKQAAARSEAKRRKARGAVMATHCFHCGDELPEPYHAGRFAARCFKCKRQWHYAYMRDRTARTRPVVAPCRDCGDPIALKRKGPKSIRCAPCVKKNRRALWIKYAQVYRHMRRAWKYATGYEKFSPLEIYERDRWRCGVCRKPISKKLRHPNPMSVSLDHKISLSRGGPHSRANAQPSHLRCNIRKNKYDALPGEQMPLPIVF